MPNVHSRPELPIELVRDIFEIAAIRSKATVLTLVRVSKDIHAWILPFLFRNVFVEEFSQLKGIIDCALNYGGDNGETMLACIHRLAIGWAYQALRDEEVEEMFQMVFHIIKNGTNLRSLLVHDRFSDLATGKVLCQSTSIKEIYYSWNPSAKGFVSKITHLHVSATPEPLVIPYWRYDPIIDSVDAFPRLSCVSFFDYERCRFDPSNPLPLCDLVLGLLRRPSIHIVVITFIQDERTSDVIPIPAATIPFRQKLETIADPRLCLLSEGITSCEEVCMKRWAQGSEGGNGFWEEMEELVESQRRAQNKAF